jgi:RNA polymerase sigma factor (sigma-70 family)
MDNSNVVGAVRALQAGQAPDAAETLVRRASRLALRTASVLTGSREEADEISQDVAVDVLVSIGKLRDPAAFDAWVHRITVRRVMRLLRLRRLSGSRQMPLALVTERRSNGDEVELVSLRAALGEALAQLPDRQRLAVALRYVHDLSHAEIAKALGCRVGTVDSLLSRARGALRTSDALTSYAPLKEAQDATAG